MDGKKILDPEKQSVLSSSLKMEILHPLRVVITSRGPDTELLVANPVELSGKGRPRVFYDVTVALKTLGICIFLVRRVSYFSCLKFIVLLGAFTELKVIRFLFVEIKYNNGWILFFKLLLNFQTIMGGHYIHFAYIASCDSFAGNR